MRKITSAIAVANRSNVVIKINMGRFWLIGSIAGTDISVYRKNPESCFFKISSNSLSFGRLTSIKQGFPSSDPVIC